MILTAFSTNLFGGLAPANSVPHLLASEATIRGRLVLRSLTFEATGLNSESVLDDGCTCFVILAYQPNEGSITPISPGRDFFARDYLPNKT